MKKVLSLILALVLCLSLCACGSSSKTYLIGETVSTDIFSFTLDAAALTIALNNVTNDDYYLPKEYNPADDSDNPYVASMGKTWVGFTYTVQNLNRDSSEFHSGGFVRIKHNGKNYGSIGALHCEDGAYYLYADQRVMDTSGSLITEKAGKWYRGGASNMLLMVGAKETRRSYVELDADIANLNDEFYLTVLVPNSKGKTESFTYYIPARS